MVTGLLTTEGRRRDEGLGKRAWSEHKQSTSREAVKVSQVRTRSTTENDSHSPRTVSQHQFGISYHHRGYRNELAAWGWGTRVFMQNAWWADSSQVRQLQQLLHRGSAPGGKRKREANRGGIWQKGSACKTTKEYCRTRGVVQGRKWKKYDLAG